jgi:hypothetical protein
VFLEKEGGRWGSEVQFLMFLQSSLSSSFLLYSSLLFTLPVVVGQFKWKIFEFATLCKGRAFRNSGRQIMIQ